MFFHVLLPLPPDLCNKQNFYKKRQFFYYNLQFLVGWLEWIILTFIYNILLREWEQEFWAFWGKNMASQRIFSLQSHPLYTSSYMESNVSNSTSLSVRFSNHSVYPDREKKIYFDILYLGDISFPRLVSVS